MIRTAMRQAGDLETLGDTPLVVVTAKRAQEPGWLAAQDNLTTLSSNSDHRFLPNATHDMVVGDEDTARDASAAHRYREAPSRTTAASESATTSRTTKARPPPAVAASVPAVGDRELAITRRSPSTRGTSTHASAPPPTTPKSATAAPRSSS